ncbi:MAG: alpha/beta hydrolase [Cyanobacteria bacterium J06560_6]
MEYGFKSFFKFATTGLFTTSLLASVGAIANLAFPKSVSAAEEIRLNVGGPIAFSISVDSLATFVETGEVKDDLRIVTRFLDEDNLQLVRQTLQRPIPLDVVQIDNLAYSTLGDDLLQNFGKVLRTHPDINGARGLRGALITAAAQAGPEGWTAIDVLQQFPGRSIDIQLGDLLALRRSLSVYFGYNEAVVAAVQGQSAAEAAQQQAAGASAGLALQSLSQPGPYQYARSTLSLSQAELRQTNDGLQVNYDFTVEAYIPQGLTQPAPVIFISHGFGDIQESFDFIASHLASHGYVAMLPQHVGSDLSVRQNFLQGFVNTILSPSEFVSRPQEVSLVIDELERLVATSPDWAATLDLDRIGVIGDSLGGSTALSLAGAEIDYARIEALCGDEQVILNTAMYLQCQARFLPPQNLQLGDERIKAVMVSHPLGGGLFGPTGMSQIGIPLMMFSGSNDIVASTVEDQVHPFIWTGSQDKYLALLTEGTHFTVKPGREGVTGFITLFTGENRDVGSRYFKEFNIAFWNTYLREQTKFLPYLSARYGEQTSEGEPLQLDIVESLSFETLETAYGQSAPIAVVPESGRRVSRLAREESILAEIERTGVLKVALRQDAPPFGYVDSDSDWVGYCRRFATDLQSYVDQAVGSRVEVGLVEISSTLDNRFSLVQDDVVHVECGPNTIRLDVEGVAFSSPLLVSGTQLLVTQGTLASGDNNPRLDDLRVAILPETTTEQFMRETFPQANLVPFPGPAGRSEAVSALSAGEVDVFASEGVLSLGELLRQNLPVSNYALVPERPLTCDFYGLALPDDDPQWQMLLNDFLEETHTERLQAEVPSALLKGQIKTLDYCLNQATN